MANSLYQALGGGLPTQVPQQAAPSPVPSGAPGEGSIFQALAQSPMQQMGAQPAQLGPMVADNKDTGFMQGNPYYEHKAMQQANYTIPENQAGSKRADQKIMQYPDTLEALKAVQGK